MRDSDCLAHCQYYAVFAERHAATIKQTVITLEKTMGIVKKYIQLNTVAAVLYG